MREDRVVAGNEIDTLVVDDGPLPSLPGFGRNGMRGGADGKQIDHHQLAVVRPARVEESALGVPAHGKRLAAVQHPGPIDALVNLRGQVLNFRIVEVRAGGEHAAKEKGRVHGRELALVPAGAGIHVVKVVVEAVLVRHVLPEEAQTAARAF